MRVPGGRRPRTGGEGDRAHARQRVPRPFIRRRVPSGRGATEQPNAVGDGPAPLTLLFWVLLVATGAATGLFGALTMLVLHTAQHLALPRRLLHLHLPAPPAPGVVPPIRPRPAGTPARRG